MLMVKRDDRAIFGQRAQGSKVGVAAEDDVADHLRRGFLGAGRKKPEVHTEGSRRRRGHAGELSAADQTHAGGTRDLTHSETLLVPYS